MQKMTATFTDQFTGEKATQDFYFHLTTMELVDLEAEKSIKEKLEYIVETQDMMQIFKSFKDILVMSYGVRTTDGRFYKDEVETKIFAASNAIDEIVFQLLSDENLASEFINNVIPKDLDKRTKQLAKPQDHKAKAVKK